MRKVRYGRRAAGGASLVRLVRPSSEHADHSPTGVSQNRAVFAADSSSRHSSQGTSRTGTDRERPRCWGRSIFVEAR